MKVLTVCSEEQNCSAATSRLPPAIFSANPHPTPASGRVHYLLVLLQSARTWLLCFGFGDKARVHVCVRARVRGRTDRMINRSSGEAAAASGGWGLGESSATHQKKNKKIQQRRRPGVCCHFLCRSVQPAAAAPCDPPPQPPSPPTPGRRLPGERDGEYFKCL